jgi:NAD(P)-dependent dehydrogenase (short-subunit alcohol dehydrogenase family)
MTQKIFVDGVLKGRVALVTGGGTGITGGVARALAEAGANVALISRKIEHLEPAAAAINDARAGNQDMGEAFAVAADVRE